MAVIGLARSGRAAARLLARQGQRVYASDAGDGEDLRGAAEELRAAGVDVDLAGHDLGRIRAAAMVVVSPGVPSDAPPLDAARRAGVEIVSEVTVALQALPAAKVIAVTGTNGKSTTTALIAHLLRTLAQRVEAAGNIGQAVSDLALRADPPEWIALEMSSFQLHDTPGFAPLVGVLTNLSPDHLDRYPGVEEYYADKRLMFAAATDQSRWVTNADDAAVQEMTRDVPGRHFRFSVERPADAWYDREGGQLHLLGSALCARAELQLMGEHNLANALAAALAVAVALDASRDLTVREGLRHGLRSFGGLPHRLEPLGEFEGVLWVNDSKATNVESARVAVTAMRRPTVLLLGGRHKGESYRALLNAGADRVRHVIAYGEAAGIIARDFAGSPIPVEILGSNFSEVVAAARAAARPGDAVLLAPACSSFDMFRDYEERGSTFRRLVTGR